MKTLVLLLAIATLPATVGIATSLLFWRNRSISNLAIFAIGLIVLVATLIAELVPVFLRNEAAPGFLYILVSTLNLGIYRLYERRLFTRRCPFCGFPTLRIRSHGNGRYILYCRNCKLFSQWDAYSRR